MRATNATNLTDPTTPMSPALGRPLGSPPRRASRGLAALALAGLALLGCAPLFPDVLPPADIADLRDGTPSIRRVRDLGAVHIGRPGPLAGESDGVTHVGELLLIEGSGFGKQPTVGIAGRPAEVRWRTSGGGIVVQVPAGCAIGPQRLWVAAGGTRDEVPLTLHRLAVVLDPRPASPTLHAVRVGGSAAPAAAGPPIAVGLPGQPPLSMALSPDGAAAYVLLAAPSAQGDAVSTVQVIDLLAPGGPKLVDTRKLRQRAHLITAAEQTGLLALVGDEEVTLWDVSEGRRPAGYLPATLPTAAQKAWAATLHPRGDLLALALADSNDVVLVDVTLRPDRTGTRPRDVATLNALPEVRQPLLHRLRFASDGETLWLSSGDNAQSLAFGHQPTRLSALLLSRGAAPGSGGAGELGLSLLRTVELRTPSGPAGAPVDLALARRAPIASGTTIRMPPDKAAVFVSTLSGAKAVAGSSLAKTAAASPTTADDKIRGAVLRGDLNGQARALSGGEDAEIVAGLDLSPGAELVVSARLLPRDGTLRVSVTDLLSGGDTSLPLSSPSPTGAPAVAGDLFSLSQIPVLLQP